MTSSTASTAAVDGPIDYLHPSLEPIMTPTYGVILYQEQVMQIAQVLAGYTLGRRRPAAPRDGQEEARRTWPSSARCSSTARWRAASMQALAAHIFDLMEKFAGYGFNKSHSAAYALLSYQTAYLKAHYPAEFMAAVLSADMEHTDKVVTLIQECADIGLQVLPPDVNASLYAFAANGAAQHPLRPGRGARGRGGARWRR